MSEIRFRQAFLILLVAAVSIAFVAMIRTFLLTILMAAIFSGVAYPVYRRLRHLLGGRQALASITTIVLLLALVMVPLGAVLAAIANQALRMSDNVRPRLQRMVDQPGEIETRLRALPGFARIEPYREQILRKAGELVGSTGSFLVNAISATTVATAVFFFQFVVMLYTMFFFLIGGPGLLRGVLAYLPLTEGDKERMIERFVSVTRATLKGSVLIGMAQGTLSRAGVLGGGHRRRAVLGRDDGGAVDHSRASAARWCGCRRRSSWPPPARCGAASASPPSAVWSSAASTTCCGRSSSAATRRCTS